MLLTLVKVCICTKFSTVPSSLMTRLNSWLGLTVVVDWKSKFVWFTKHFSCLGWFTIGSPPPITMIFLKFTGDMNVTITIISGSPSEVIEGCSSSLLAKGLKIPIASAGRETFNAVVWFGSIWLYKFHVSSGNSASCEWQAPLNPVIWKEKGQFIIETREVPRWWRKTRVHKVEKLWVG